MRILLLCLALSTFFPSRSFAALVDKTAALVNSDVITLSDAFYFRKNLNLRRELDPFFAFFRMDPKTDAEIINYLIQEVLILQKLAPTTEEVEEEINSIQRNNKIDRQKLQEVLASQGVSFPDYYALMKVSVSKRKLMDRELRPVSQVTDEEVKNYYYTAPEFRESNKGRKLILSYDLEQLLIPSKELADQAYRALKRGDDFVAVADSLQGQGVERNSLGMLPEDKLSALVRKAIDGLRVGDFSDPIYTGSGYFILRIQQIGAPKDAIFEREREAIRNTLFQKAMARGLNFWTDRERAQSYIFIP